MFICTLTKTYNIQIKLLGRLDCNQRILIIQSELLAGLEGLAHSHLTRCFTLRTYRFYIDFNQLSHRSQLNLKTNLAAKTHCHWLDTKSSVEVLTFSDTCSSKQKHFQVTPPRNKNKIKQQRRCCCCYNLTTPCQEIQYFSLKPKILGMVEQAEMFSCRLLKLGSSAFVSKIHLYKCHLLKLILLRGKKNDKRPGQVFQQSKLS